MSADDHLQSGSPWIRRLESPAWPAGILAAALAVLAALATAYAFLAFPASDDFCRAVANPDGAPAQAGLLYQVWTGRWLTSLFFAWLTPRLGLYGIGYSLALLAAMLVWLLGFRVAAGMLLGGESLKRHRWALASLLFAIFWAGAPGPSEIFYWLSGAFEYGGPFTLMMVALRLIGGVAAPRHALAAAIGAGCFGILASGGHELAGAILLGLGICWTIMLWSTGRRSAAGYALIAIALIAAGLAANLLAPGNAARASLFPHAGSVPRALGLTFGQGETPIAWLLDLRLLALSLFLLVVPAFGDRRPAWTEAKPPIAIIIPAATIAAVIVGWFLGAYGVGFTPPLRLQSLLYALFVIGWTATVIALRYRVHGLWAAGHARTIPAFGAAGLLAGSLLLSANSQAATGDLPFARTLWLRLNHERLHVIAVARQKGIDRSDVTLSGGWSAPRLLMRANLSDDPTEFTNRCASQVLGVRSVRMAPGQSEMRRIWRE